ncbi:MULTISPECIES: outer membrane beta-barrel protein [Corallincola]|uniref:Uncharacterized protein n=3 Tax=Corallincola TaxID=1775176 RepID=A0A368N3T4_9GAMM|nr:MULTISPECIES: outer membrane beta-barrel protein [Corallincola]RCU45192.1 hypothetical protein DU002_17350 [Corallincola holothuriorum]TAA46758.1 hypothetical protein EXY25_05750 [Corallincola spongiicola]TCI04403.1 hypothetical protein EZV61_00035 [Corallincola luteus]
MRILLALTLFSIILPAHAAREWVWEAALMAGTSGSDSFTESDDSDYTLDTDSGDTIAFTLNLLDGHKKGNKLQYELYLAQTNTDLELFDNNGTRTTSDMDINYYHFGGTYEFVVRDTGLRPYIGATLGATYFDPEEYSSETNFSMGFAGGLKWFANDYVGLRLDGRAIATAMDSDKQVFCNGGCLVKVDSEIWWQYQVTAGLLVKF